MPSVTELIAKGPVSHQEAAAGAEAVKAAAAPEFSTPNEDATTSAVLSSFDKIINKDSDSSNEAKIKADLDKEEASADDSEDTEQEPVSKGNEGDKKEVQEAKKEVSEKPVEVSKPKLFPTAKVASIEEELKGIIPDSSFGFFKKMDNSAKQFVTAEFKRLKGEQDALKQKLEIAEKEKAAAPQGLPSGWYEHEEAFTITPEYKSLQSEKSTLIAIEQHYRQQLISIKNGEDWFDLVKDAKGGIVQVKQKASPEADVNVLTRIHSANNILSSLEKKEQEIVQAFKNQATNHRAGMKQLEAQYFPQYEDAKVMESNEDVKTIKEVLAGSGLINDRLSGMLTKLYAFSMEQTRRVQELEAKISNNKSVVLPKNGPTGDEINSGATTNKSLDPDDKPFNLKGFESYTK